MSESRTSVFSPEFLHLSARPDPSPTLTPEAACAGPWQVERRGKEYAVVRTAGGEPEAVVSLRETALLLAAVLPGCGRGPLYWLGEAGEAGEVPFPLKTVMGARGMDRVGRLRYHNDELLVALSTAEYVLRSPTALSFLLEAAPPETLRQADAELTSRLAARQRGEPVGKSAPAEDEAAS